MRGAGRPAASAAARRRGATWDSMARALAIHVIVPAARSPATRRRRGPSAATSTGISPCGSAGGWAFTRKSSPWNDTCSPRSRSATTWTYSSVCRPGWEKSMPCIISITGWCDGPMPRVKPGRPIAATTAAARLAMRLGWVVYVWRTEVPSSSVDVP